MLILGFATSVRSSVCVTKFAGYLLSATLNWCSILVVIIMDKAMTFLLYLSHCLVFWVAVIQADPELRLTELHKTKLADHFTNYGVTCVGEYNINFEDVRALQSFQMPKGEEAPCFFACILKKTQLMDAHGKIAPEAVLAVAKSVFEDEKDLNEAVKVFQACAYVNDREVNDGSKGCERAMLALSCLMEQSKLEDADAPGAGAGGVRPHPKGKAAKFIMGGIINHLLQLACAGVATAKQIFPLRLISDFVPVDTIVALCSLIST